MSDVQTKIRIHVFHTGRVCVSPGLPFKDKEKNPHPVQLTLLSAYGRRQRIWLPVSAYLIEHPQGCLLVDTGWHREISPQGEYSRFAQIRHRSFAAPPMWHAAASMCITKAWRNCGSISKTTSSKSFCS